jgi:hypothetical protein
MEFAFPSFSIPFFFSRSPVSLIYSIFVFHELTLDNKT